MNFTKLTKLRQCDRKYSDQPVGDTREKVRKALGEMSGWNG